jgi:rhodanese-related sulfurtransferase
VHLPGGQEQIRAVVPSPVERDLLGITEAPAVAALGIDPLGCAHGHPVEWRHTMVRGDRFSVTAEFPTGTGYRLDTTPTPKGHPMTTPDETTQVDPTEADKLATHGALLLDVREPEVWAAGHIPGAVHMPLGSLGPSSVPSDRVVVAVCRSGSRFGKAAANLVDAGIDVRNLAGGMKAWAEDGRTVACDDGSTGTVA